MSIWSKIGGFLKKAAPVAAIAANFIPGIGPAIAGGISAISGLSSAREASAMGPNDGPQLPNPQVQVTGAASGGSFLRDIMPAVQGGLNYYGQQQTNVANAEQAQRQMDFQNQQTSTSYQRGVADMRAAGLNPMLAYSQGGAQSGSGARAEMGNSIGAGANSALSAMQTMQQMENVQSQTEVNEAQAGFLRAQRMSELQKPALFSAQTGDTKASEHQRGVQSGLVGLQSELARRAMDDQLREIASAADLRRAQSHGEGARAMSSELGLAKDRVYRDYWNSSFGQSFPYLSDIGTHTNSALGAFRKLLPFGGR